MAVPVPVEFEPTELEGILLVKGRIFTDSRGYFTEVFSQEAWEQAGFRETFVQDNLSRSSKGTLRGMHYQLSSHGMGKLVRVVKGAVFDVAVDLRRGSPTFGRWFGCELNDRAGVSLYIPVGFAHGFLALEDDTLVLYKCTAAYAPQAERSLHYNDPQVAIRWPFQPTTVSRKDAAAPPLESAEYDFVY